MELKLRIEGGRILIAGNSRETSLDSSPVTPRIQRWSIVFSNVTMSKGCIKEKVSQGCISKRLKKKKKRRKEKEWVLYPLDSRAENTLTTIFLVIASLSTVSSTSIRVVNVGERNLKHYLYSKWRIINFRYLILCIFQCWLPNSVDRIITIKIC